MGLAPVTLEDEAVALMPFDEEQADALFSASVGSDVWRFMPMEIKTAEAMRGFITAARALNDQGLGLGFSVRHKRCGEIVGGTGFWARDVQHRRVEIGATWVARSHQRGEVNTRAKLLLLEHAFGRLGCLRVEFKTDARNEKSRAALLRIGAREEGTLRHHMLLHDGSHRDSVYFSILDDEWPSVRKRLAAKLAHSGGG